MIYNGGSDKDNLFNVWSGNSPPSTILSTGNQMFISFTNNDNGLGKGFSASFVFGKKVENF